MSLSDNLKPWSVIARRLQLAAQADFAMAFYNPRSSSRSWQRGGGIEHSEGGAAGGDAGGVCGGGGAAG